MSTERTELGRELEGALGEVLAHVRGDTQLPCRIIDDPTGKRIVELRERLKLSRRRFADRFGLDARAVQEWEQGRRVPDRAARVLLTVIERDPEAVARALADPSPGASRLDVVREVVKPYRAPVMNNVHRSEYVEAMVAVALARHGWSRKTPWDSWDLEHETGFRLEVKQSAAAQGWGGRATSPPRFDIRARTGYWDAESNTWRSSPGRHADVYVFAWHGDHGEHADQREPASWRFYVLLERDLPDQKSIGLGVIRRRVKPCRGDGLHARLLEAARALLELDPAPRAPRGPGRRAKALIAAQCDSSRMPKMSQTRRES